MEKFIPLDGSAGNAAPTGTSLMGGRRHKLKLVTRKAARKMLKKLGAKMRGGADDAPGAVVVETPKAAVGGRRRTARAGMYHMGGKKRRSASRKASLGKMFGL